VRQGFRLPFDRHLRKHRVSLSEGYLRKLRELRVVSLAKGGFAKEKRRGEGREEHILGCSYTGPVCRLARAA
jgi:hypothetical protein